jgi:hypothetical protein
LQRRAPAATRRGQQNPSEPPMLGIAVIALFIVVIGALNIFEFGRLD